jgi:hypothetical protein
MKLYRYMSKKELEKYNAGKYIIGNKHNSKRTTIKQGVSFLAEQTKFTSYFKGDREIKSCYTPKECAAFLIGIVDDEVLAEFEVLNESCLRVARGTYADPVNLDLLAKIDIDEYSLKKYSNKELKLTNAWQR